MRRITLLSILLISAAFGQPEYSSNLGTVQAIGFFGAQHIGAGNLGTHPVLGADVLVGLNRYLSATGEYAYNPTGNLGLTAVNSNIQDLFGGIDVHPAGWRLVPFGSGGIGGIRGAASVSAPGFTGSVSTWEAGFNFGGGVRTYLTRRIGIAVDVRGIRTFRDIGAGTFVRATGGLFLQFN